MKTVIIGAGPAGVTVAETLRQNGMRGNIVMLSGEPFPPYAPPAMLEYFISGQEAHLWRWENIAERLELDYKTGTMAAKVIPEPQHIWLTNGDTLSYERLVIATGSRLYTPVPGAKKQGVYNFKSLSAAKELMQQVREGTVGHACIAGAGFIGVEIALLLSHAGAKVTLVEMADRILPRMLDGETAGIALQYLREQHIKVRLNARITAFIGESRAEAVQLESGETLRTDVLVAATGVKPNIEFLKNSGIHTQWGILTDDHLQTNIPGIYAAGDVAETVERLSGKRYVHAIFPNAVEQGQVVAHNLLGHDITYQGAENMNSLKHLGLPIIAVGRMDGEELRTRRNSVVRKIYVQDGCIVGFRLVGDIRAAGIYRTLMHKKVNVESIQARLLEPNFGIGHVPELIGENRNRT